MQASNWVVLNSDGADPTVSIDQQSIAKKGKYVKAWFLFTYSSPHIDTEAYPFKAYTSTKVLQYVDCVEKTSAIVQSAYYNKSDFVGGLQSDISKVQFTEPIPDTLGEAQMVLLCNPSKLTK